MLQKPGICAGQMGHQAGLQSLVFLSTKEYIAVKARGGKTAAGRFIRDNVTSFDLFRCMIVLVPSNSFPQKFSRC